MLQQFAPILPRSTLCPKTPNIVTNHTEISVFNIAPEPFKAPNATKVQKVLQTLEVLRFSSGLD